MEKMQKTFSYRRQEVVQDAPVISEFVDRCPALFTVREVNIDDIDILHTALLM